MDLKKARKKIDAIDRGIVELLDERVRLVESVAAEKRKTGRHVYDAGRERTIISRAVRRARAFPAEQLKDLFRRVIQVSRTLEEELRIGYFGPAGTYTHEAALAIFGEGVKYVPQKTIPELFEMTDKGDVHYSVVPFENTTEGIVTHTIDMFNDYDLKIISEHFLRITQNLLSKEKTLRSIRKVYSHRQALAQTARWVRNYLPWAKVVETDSTAAAARIASRQKGSAAIGSEASAGIYGLPVIQASIEDSDENFTRFLVIGRANHNGPTRKDKTSILFTVKDEPGSLYGIISLIARAGINMTKIESRPFRGRPWEYFFFVDLSGHWQDRKIQKALELLKKKTMDLKVLGSYPDSGADGK